MTAEPIVLDYTRAPWDPEGPAHETDLTTVIGCQAELQWCSKGLAYLDHLYGIVLDRLTELEVQWDLAQAEAVKYVRREFEDALTATEVKSLAAEWLENNRAELRADYHRARNRKAKIERWQRTAEKRMSASQSASNGHEQLARGGGA